MIRKTQQKTILSGICAGMRLTAWISGSREALGTAFVLRLRIQIEQTTLSLSPSIRSILLTRYFLSSHFRRVHLVFLMSSILPLLHSRADESSSEESPYGYSPTRAVSIIFIVLFAASTCTAAPTMNSLPQLTMLKQLHTPARPSSIGFGGCFPP